MSCYFVHCKTPLREQETAARRLGSRDTATWTFACCCGHVVDVDATSMLGARARAVDAGFVGLQGDGPLFCSPSCAQAGPTDRAAPWPVLTWPSGALKRRTALGLSPMLPSHVTAMGEALVATMLERGAAGLAAPQLGWPVHAIAVDLRPEGPEPQPLLMLDPVSLFGGTPFAGIITTREPERCLSVPGLEVKVRRWAQVDVAWISPPARGETRHQTMRLKGRVARAFLHELDHLAGITLLDHVSVSRRRAYERRCGVAPAKERAT